MKIVCPNCEAAYEVPEAVASSNRPMRCARCKQEWVPGQKAAEEAPPEPQADILAEATEAQFEPAPPPQVEDFPPAEPEPVPAEPVAVVVPVAPPIVIPEPAPPVAAPPPPAPLKVRPAVPPPFALGPEPPRPAAQPLGAWAASIALVVVLTGAGLAFRGPVMKAWPPSTRLYAAVGLR